MTGDLNDSYKAYIIDNFKFVCTSAFDMIPPLLGIIFFNWAGDQDSIGVLGFIISSFHFFYCLCYNHSEVINLKSGTHFSDGNFRECTKNILQCVLVNTVFYAVCVGLCFQCRDIFDCLGIKGQFLETVSHYLPVYGLFGGTLFMLVNITRGNFLVENDIKAF